MRMRLRMHIGKTYSSMGIRGRERERVGIIYLGSYPSIHLSIYPEDWRDLSLVKIRNVSDRQKIKSNQVKVSVQD